METWCHAWKLCYIILQPRCGQIRWGSPGAHLCQWKPHICKTTSYSILDQTTIKVLNDQTTHLPPTFSLSIHKALSTFWSSQYAGPISLLNLICEFSPHESLCRWCLEEGGIVGFWIPQHRKKITPHHCKKSCWNTNTARYFQISMINMAHMAFLKQHSPITTQEQFIIWDMNCMWGYSWVNVFGHFS